MIKRLNIQIILKYHSNSRVCSLHFKDNDFQTERKDAKWMYRKGPGRPESIEDPVIKRTLLPNSIPSTFPTLPKYFEKTVPDRRSESTSKDARFQKQYDAMESASNEFLASDKISSLEELKEKVENDLPPDIMKIFSEAKVTLYSLKEDENGQPFVNYSLIIRENLSFSMWCNQIEIPPSQVAQHCKNKMIHSCIGISNILSHLKRTTEDKVLLSKNTVGHCISLLSKIIPDLEEEVMKKVDFLNEQLKLAIKNKYARRYSPGLLSCAAIWKMVSPALYKQLWEEGNYMKIASKITNRCSQSNNPCMNDRIGSRLWRPS